MPAALAGPCIASFQPGTGVAEVAAVSNPGSGDIYGRDESAWVAVIRGVSRLPSNLRHEKFRSRDGSSWVADALQSVDLVVFDCDGVIADSEVLSASLLIRQLLDYDIRIDAEYVYRNFVGKSFPVVADIIGERFEVALPSTFVSDYRAALREAFADSLQTTPGFLDMLGQLTCRSCVATSSSPPRVANTLETLGLADYFGADVFTASQVARGKPAPDLFLFAARAMATPPERCLVIEDSVAGIEAGLAAGMNVWRYVGASHIADVARARGETPADVTVFDNWERFYLLAPELRA